MVMTAAYQRWLGAQFPSPAGQRLQNPWCNPRDAMNTVRI
jgi:hypothetical protein